MSNRIHIKSSKRGFTLIELLVVIAIIAILASILFPVFARARDNARRAAGLSNVKQILLGFLQYQNDYDGRYLQTVSESQAPDVTGGPAAPTAPASYGVQSTYTNFSYRAKLQPYVKSEQLFKDPSAPQWNADPTVSTPSTLAWSGWYPVDYGFNQNEGNLNNTERQQAWFKQDAFHQTFGVNELNNQSSITNTSRFILIGEAARGDGTSSRGGLYPFYDTSDPVHFYAFPGGPGDPAHPTTGGTTASQARSYKRHFDGVIFGYADGHAKWKHEETTWVDPTVDTAAGANNEWNRNVQ